MITVALLLAALAQQQDESPYVIVMKDGERVYAWVDEERLDDTIIPVERDAPWLPASERKINLRSNDIDLDSTYRELPVSRARRIAEGWQAHGGAEVETRTGTTWIDAEEVEWAHRAQKQFAAKQETYRESVTRQSQEGVEQSANAEAGFTELWGGHIAVLTVGLGLAAAVTWFLLLQ